MEDRVIKASFRMTGILFQTLRDGWSTLTETWESLNMKFGLRLAGALLGSAAVVQSQCPDYTTFSQVRHFYPI